MSVDLKPFCGDNDIRYYLNEPFSEGEFTYATNGHILIRVPRRDDIPEEKTMSDRAPKLFVDFAMQKSLDIPEVPAPEMVDCECVTSNGDLSETEVLQKCEDCGGTFKVELWGVGIDLGDSRFALRYLRLLKTLPNCKISPNGQKQAPFKFDGGDGLLMPMRKQ